MEPDALVATPETRLSQIVPTSVNSVRECRVP